MRDIEDFDSFGALLRERRLAAGLTQEDLAARAGLSARSIQNLERGENRPRLESLKLLADALALGGEQRIRFETAAQPLHRRPRGDRHRNDSRPRSNLPNRLVSFVGREAELARLGDLLERYRLITLTGPGGVGKTSLALQAATDNAGDFDDGVFFVSLASLAEPDLVASTLARTLGAPDAPGRRATDVLCETIGEKRLLLVVDNFEPVVEAAPIVAELLGACPGLTVLVTSRAVLRLHGEHIFIVEPLAVPDLGSSATADRVMRYAAGRLFAERAQAARADFILTDEHAPAVAEICARVEGSPLAIELAAARTRLLSPRALLERLTPLLPLLSGGARDRPARHQTMRAAVAWSYDLLDGEEKALFRRLSAFAGGFTLDAALTIGRREDARDVGLLDRIESLVDQSLLRLEAAPDITRLRMLETIREYGWERLAECGEMDSARREHAAYFFTLVEATQRPWNAPIKREWLVRVEQERQNVRAALRWFIDSGDVTRALRLAAALGPFWLTHGPLSEGRARLSEVLALSAATTPGVSSARESLLARAHALHGLACLARRQSDYRAARRHHGESLAILREVGDRQDLACALVMAANVELQDGDLAAARHGIEEIAAAARETGDQLSLSNALTHLGVVALHEEDYSEARICLEEVLNIAREAADVNNPSPYALHAFGCVALGESKLAEARAHLLEALAIALENDDKTLTANLLEALSALAVACSSPERAIRLAGAASVQREVMGVRIAPVWDRWLGPRLQAARSAFGPEASDRAWREGQAMSFDRAVVYASEEGRA